MVEYKNEVFIINGKPVFLVGGELHYFRVPRSEWRDRIIKLKEAGCNLVSTYIPWIWHEMEEGSFDLTGLTTPERDLQYFLELVEEQEMYSLVRPGPYVMAEIRNEGLPHWIYSQYPEVIAVTEEGNHHPTRVVSYLHPKFIELVDRWYSEVFKIITPKLMTNNGNILMVQLDNEVGMLQWVTNQGDYSDNVIDNFIKYIKENKNFCNFIEPFRNNETVEEFIRNNIKKPHKEYAIPLQQEFLLYMRKYYKDYLEKLKEIAEKYGMDVPMIINVHGFDSVDYAGRGGRYPIGLSQLYETAKIENSILAGDYYIGNIVSENFPDLVLANALTKAIQNKEQPLFSAEFQGGTLGGIKKLQPSTYELNTTLCIANGMNALNYYMFVGGENWEDIGLFGRRHDWQAPIGTYGELKRQYYVIKELIKTVNTYADELLHSKKVDNVHIGFDPDYYMTEYHNEHTLEQKRIIQRYREEFFYNGIGRGLTVNNYSYEAIDIKAVSSIDVNEAPVLVTLSTPYMNEDIQTKLVDYVDNGGKLIIYPVLPTKTLRDEPCTILIDRLGVDVKGIIEWGNVNVDKIDSVNIHQTELYNNVEGFAHRVEFPESPIAFEKQIGKGKIIVFGIGMVHDYDYKDLIIEDLLNRVDISKPFKTDETLNVFLRKGEKGSFLFLLNYEEFEKETQIKYLNEYLFDGEKVKVPYRKSLILPLNWKVFDDIEIIYSTAEFTGKRVVDNYLELTIRCKQDIETILVESNTWVPQTDNNIKVTDTNKNTYKIQTLNNTSECKLLFAKS